MKSKKIYDIKISNNELLYKIKYHLDNKIPLSVIRKSDGENVIIGYRNIKGIRLIKYIKKLRHFNISYFNFSFQKLFRKELINSFHDADYIGVPIKYFYYGYTSSVRKFEPKITESAKNLQKKIDIENTKIYKKR